MKKTELIKAVSIDTGIGQKDVTRIFESIFVQISEDLKNENELIIKDFGTFKMKTRPERMGRNPKTGESILIPEKHIVKFTAYKNILNMKWL
jgi:nucleoid DNA-binding protein